MILLTRFSALAITTAIFLLPVSWAADKYKVLHAFGGGKDGSVPFGSLTPDAKGNFYGVTAAGGGLGCDGYGCGAVFELSRNTNGSWTEKVLYSFPGGSDGSDPDGGLILDGAGNLYGTIIGDGSVSVGGVFELSPGPRGWNYSVLYTEDAGPGVVMDKGGNLYGEIGPGNYFHIGAIGELSPGSNGWTYTDLANFNPTVGYSPPAPPIWDGKGNMFGTTEDGGISQPACWTSSGCGVLFEMSPNKAGGWAYHILHRFASFADDGESPDGGLVLDASGDLYGVTGLGGVHDQGTLFKFAFAGGHWKQTVLYDFPNCADGCFPGRTLVFDKLGNLYGISDGGIADCGGYTCGVVFKLAPQKNGKWTYSVLHKFTGKDGAFPWGVIVDDKGNLFGTTENGGKYNSGVAFEIAP
jgi:uncharacterized repeat protein (TIGR03803 family)